MSRRQLETAKQIVAVLGTMKGAAMKLGQVMSFLDVGLVPEEHREEFQRELAKLRDAAPTVSFKQMRRVIEEDLEDPIDEVFESFDEEPIAAASIGQVYRATLAEDGREVAVKVQYPGVAGRRQGGPAEPRHDHAAAQADDPRARRQRDHRGDPGAHRRGARLRARGPEPALAGPDLRGPPVHLRPRRSSARSRASGCSSASSSTAWASRRSRNAARTSATASARSCSASSWGASTVTASSPGTPTRATSCCSRTAAWRSWTSACSSAWSRPPSSSSSPPSGPSSEGDAPTLHELLAEVGVPARTRARGPRAPARLHHGSDLVVHDGRRSRPAHARDRHPGDDRELGPPLELLPRDAPPGRCAPSTSSGGAWRCSRSPSCPSCGRARTGTGSRASGCTARSPVTELGREEADFYGRRELRPTG